MNERLQQLTAAEKQKATIELLKHINIIVDQKATN